MASSLSLRLLGLAGIAVSAFLLGRWTADRSASFARSKASGDGKLSSASVAKASSSDRAAAKASALSVRTLAAAAARPVTNVADEEARLQAIEQWAESDPRGALEFIRTKLRGDRQAQALAAILAVWGKNDPDAAWSWLNTELPSATHHFDTLLEVFGRSSTETAGRFAARFAAVHPEAALEVHLAALLGVTHRGDFAGARSLIEGNASLDPATRATLNNFLAGQWARFAPQEAAAWVANLPPGPQRDQALIGLGESWSEVDPAAAATFAAGLPTGSTRTLALRQAIGKWVATDAEAARAWVVNTERHEDFDQAIGSIATDANLVSRDPGRALKWAGTIFDDELRTRSLGAILFNWYPLNPAAATAYVQASPDFTPEQRAEILARLQAKN